MLKCRKGWEHNWSEKINKFTCTHIIKRVCETDLTQAGGVAGGAAVDVNMCKRCLIAHKWHPCNSYREHIALCYWGAHHPYTVLECLAYEDPSSAKTQQKVASPEPRLGTGQEGPHNHDEKGVFCGQTARILVWHTTITFTLKWACKGCTRASILGIGRMKLLLISLCQVLSAQLHEDRKH